MNLKNIWYEFSLFISITKHSLILVKKKKNYSYPDPVQRLKVYTKIDLIWSKKNAIQGRSNMHPFRPT